MELNNGSVKVISFYLPQFHPFEENNAWWGEGFTEWTNVGKAKPLFKGHYQPKVPADLGYYDLRVPEVAEKQAILARMAGVTGFVYYHYWFSGKTLMDMPSKRMLYCKKPNFPFCFAWANHSWFKKRWNPDVLKDELLIEQQYPGLEDIDAHFYYCLPYFRDSRYMRYNNRPMFVVYDLREKDFSDFIERWNFLCRKEKLADSFYFVANSFFEDNSSEYKRMGFDSVIVNVNIRYEKQKQSLLKQIYNYLEFHIFRHFRSQSPELVDYLQLIKDAWKIGIHDREDIIPQFMPNWDHTPRSGTKGRVYINATPENFEKMAKLCIEGSLKKQNKLLLLKSWNEWGEGNYMEPDLRFGHGFIDALQNSLKEYGQYRE